MYEYLSSSKSLNKNISNLSLLVLETIQTTKSIKKSIEALEMLCVDRVLKSTHGNKTKAAKILGVKRVTLISKLKKWGIDAKVQD